LTLDEVISEVNNSNSLSIDDIVRELEGEETNIVISKEIKKFNKPTTVVVVFEREKIYNQ
jgi:ABC-type dipeptide/oligopeptide/nickel transport system ATPase subunit